MLSSKCFVIKGNTKITRVIKFLDILSLFSSGMVAVIKMEEMTLFNILLSKKTPCL